MVDTMDKVSEGSGLRQFCQKNARAKNPNDPIT